MTKGGLTLEEYERLVHVQAFRQLHHKALSGDGKRDERRRRRRRRAGEEGGGGAYLSEMPAEDEVGICMGGRVGGIAASHPCLPPPSLLQVHPPFPLHDDWTPRPARPVESLRPWDGEDCVRFRLENYTLDAVGKLVR